VDWSSLGSGRALLFVHGTFSRAHLAFATLPPALVAELHRRYEGRVFAFDHFTLSQDPMANVRWFLSHMPDGTALDVDIVCHSRGGLVSRCFAERWSELDAGRRELKVGKVVFVGSPNAGTPLANATRMGDLIDVLTNLLDALPDNGITDVLTMIVSVAKHLAVGTTRELDGLNAMDPTGAFTSTMNRPGQSRGSRYFAVSSHVAPGQPGIRRLLVTKGLEQLFGGGSDLVVPTAGVYEANGAASFPIEERLVLSGGGAVTHTKYFADPQVQQRLLEWLQ
jgi:pimeloyl-ACP methyl ester carboxylesterase